MRQLADITLNEDALILPATTLVKIACQHMNEHKAGSVLVTDDDGRLTGIFTGRDAVHRIVAQGRDATQTVLADVMTADPVVISPDKSAINAMRLMWDGGFRHLPIVRAGEILGVVSRENFTADEEQQLANERELWEHLR